ncbi:PID-CTERM protein-sorting domain-containing protein [Confluentibacter sediminis]|uniref:PID-CTERM protein-sorting domain-containing protein n=1 Tax=Confluentibacter sediminis TaxID=2219045 RepID=UPI0013A6AF0F|nr:hypothetical protein [Confluentibacter sediminis]
MKKILLTNIRAIIIVFALTFSANMNAATTPLSFDSSFSVLFGKNKKKPNKPNKPGGGDKIPLDGGLSILLFGAAAFGVKKLHGNKKNEI